MPSRQQTYRPLNRLIGLPITRGTAIASLRLNPRTTAVFKRLACKAGKMGSNGTHCPCSTLLFEFMGTVADKWPSLLIRLAPTPRSEEHTSELQSLMRISYAVFCFKKK